jgi:hypothetical protein
VALGDCNAHLDAVRGVSGAIDTSAVEAYLARHVVVLLCAEVERALNEYFDERIDASGCDDVSKRLLKSIKRGVTRSAKHADISDTIARLGPEFREKYESLVRNAIGDEGIARIGNAVGHRDKASHSTPPAVTLSELELAAGAADALLRSVREAIGLPPRTVELIEPH